MPPPPPVRLFYARSGPSWTGLTVNIRPSLARDTLRRRNLRECSVCQAARIHPAMRKAGGFTTGGWASPWNPISCLSSRPNGRSFGQMCVFHRAGLWKERCTVHCHGFTTRCRISTPNIGGKIATFFARLAPGEGWRRANWGLSASCARNQHPSRTGPDAHRRDPAGPDLRPRRRPTPAQAAGDRTQSPSASVSPVSPGLRSRQDAAIRSSSSKSSGRCRKKLPLQTVSEILTTIT